MAIVLVKVNVGLIGKMGAGAELDLAYIAAFLALLLMGPGSASLDRAIGLERKTRAGPSRRRSGRRRHLGLGRRGRLPTILERVDLLEDRDRLGSELAVGGAVVGL